LIAGLLVVVLLGIGGAVFWKARGPRRQAADPAHEAAIERQRVAAFDPSFDPAKPAGSIEGIVKDADGKAVDGAVVAVLRNQGKNDLPAFGRPNPKVATTSGGGRFRLSDVLSGEYAVTATALQGAPARQPKVEVKSGQKTEVTLTLGRGGVLFTGEVFDVGGGPIAGARAMVRTIRDFKGAGDAGGRLPGAVRRQGDLPHPAGSGRAQPQRARGWLRTGAGLAGAVDARRPGATS
jgi:hypothetical protein